MKDVKMIKATIIDEWNNEFFDNVEIPTIPRVGEYFGIYANGSGFSTSVLKVEHCYKKSELNGHTLGISFDKVKITVRM